MKDSKVQRIDDCIDQIEHDALIAFADLFSLAFLARVPSGRQFRPDRRSYAA
jgi:hypothetical protein